MFEKDEDYRKARKESKDRITKVIKVWSAREETLHDEAFLAGAEFGYNKANEWHYVKDGDLPKENKLYFVVIKDNGLAIAYFNGLYWETRYNLGDFGHCVETVIAWKEIVLPKEIENA